jgi:hypothetical protein
MAFRRNSSVEVAPTSTPDLRWLGLNFFFHYFGVGYEAVWYDNGGTTAHMPSAGNFFLR